MSDAATQRQLVIVLPLRAGVEDAIRGLVANGPPVDLEQVPELDRHEVLLTSDEAIFVFESASCADTISAFLTNPEVWQAAGGWQEHVTGAPRVAESVYSGARPDDEDNLSFLATPGPGDSDGGDIF